jgi:hypothetical protein
MKDYQQLDASVAHSAEMLEQALPAVLQPFQDMAKSAKGEGAIPHQQAAYCAGYCHFHPLRSLYRSTRS